MPTQGDINRVSSPGLDRERAAMKVEPSHGSAIAANRYSRTVEETTQQDEGVIPSSPEQKLESVFLPGGHHPALNSIERPPQTAGSSRAEFIGKVEGFEDDDPVSVAAVTKLLTEHFANQAGNRESDLDKFKTQVIRAFKHLGLDTVKHFGV